MGWKTFYWLWLRRAFGGARAWVESAVFFFGVFVASLALFNARVSAVLGESAGLALLIAIGAVTALRLVLAPYWLWKDQTQAALTAQANLQAALSTERERLKDFENRALYAARYVESEIDRALANNGVVEVNRNAFELCSLGITSVAGQTMPRGVSEPLLDIKFILDETRDGLLSRARSEQLENLKARAAQRLTELRRYVESFPVA